MKLIKTVVFLALILCIAAPAFAQNAAADKPADNMQILREKVMADKKLIVSQNMQLTESEAKAFWPVYDAFQKDLEKNRSRGQQLINYYAEAWNSKSLDNKKANKMISDFIAIQSDEVKLLQSYIPKFKKALPATKVARYLQIENKIRAIINFDAAAKIPLVPGN